MRKVNGNVLVKLEEWLSLDTGLIDNYIPRVYLTY